MMMETLTRVFFVYVLRLHWKKSLHTPNSTAVQGRSVLDLTQSTVHATSETYGRRGT